MNNFIGISFENVRKALFFILFGTQFSEHADDFSFEKYKYILPMQNQFMNPIEENSNDTYCMYWIEEDESKTNDSYTEENGKYYNVNYCVATILIRFIGGNAESWVKSFRHHCKRDDIYKIWSGVCNAERLEYVSPIIPTRVGFFGKNNEIGYDITIRVRYREMIEIDWSLLEGLDIKVKGKLKVER